MMSAGDSSVTWLREQVTEAESRLQDVEEDIKDREKALDSLYNHLGRIEDKTSTKFKMLSARSASVERDVANLKEDKKNLEEKEKYYRRQLEKAQDAAQNAPRPPNREIHFDKWEKFPNGQGVLGATALPLTKLREKIVKLSKAPGICWVESPMGTGKTSLGQLLEEFDGFKRFTILQNAAGESGAVGRSMSGLPKFQKIVLDEAQRLNIQGIEIARFRIQEAFILCCGVPNIEPRCSNSDHPYKDRDFVCAKCLVHLCCNTANRVKNCPEGGEHSYQSTGSTTLDCQRRITVDELVVPIDELEAFLKLIPTTDYPTFDAGFAKELVSFTGGLLGWTMTLLRELCKNKGDTITSNYFSEKMTDSAALAALQSDQRTMKSFEVIDDGMWKAAGDLLTGRVVSGTDADKLCKLSLGVRGQDGQVMIRSRLHRIVLKHVMSQSPLIWDNVDLRKIVECILLHIHPGQIFEERDLQHEDAINGFCSSVIEKIKLTGVNYSSSAKLATEGAKMSDVPDHVLAKGDHTAIVEFMVLCSDIGKWPKNKEQVLQHMSRFAAGGKYAGSFTKGALVCLSDARTHSVLSQMISQTNEGTRPAVPLLTYLKQGKGGEKNPIPGLTQIPGATEVLFVELKTIDGILAFDVHRLGFSNNEFVLPTVQCY